VCGRLLDVPEPFPIDVDAFRVVRELFRVFSDAFRCVREVFLVLARMFPVFSSLIHNACCPMHVTRNAVPQACTAVPMLSAAVPGARMARPGAYSLQSRTP
jgi:hypothetical protein